MIKKSFFKIMTLILIVFGFSACSLNIDSENLTPQLFINEDACLVYSEDDEVYKIKLLPGEEYEISADLGDYDGVEFYIEYSLESEESLLSIDENIIKVSETVSEEKIENVFIKLKKQNEEKVYKTEKIEVTIVFEIIEW